MHSGFLLSRAAGALALSCSAGAAQAQVIATLSPALPAVGRGDNVLIEGPPGSIDHALVLFDRVSELARNAAGTIRFHRDAATQERQTITLCSSQRTLVPGHMSLNNRNYLNPVNSSAKANSPLCVDQGKCGKGLAAG